MDSSCIFCRIVAGEAPASVLHEDGRVLAFMNIRPLHPGEFLVIPKAHVDHFSDLDDDLACRVLVVGQRLSRNLRERLKPRRVGLVVHGYGVPHAHLNVVPLHHPDDITSAGYAVVENGAVRFTTEKLPAPTREELDETARLLS